MAKERRTVGPTRRSDLNNARGTPYDRPRGSTHNRTNAHEGELVRLGDSSQPLQHQKSAEDNDAGRRSSWSSWVYTPLKALKDSYNYLSKSPLKNAEVDDNVDGHPVNQTASSTAAELVEEGETHSQKVADQYSSREEQAGPSNPADMVLPERALGNLPSLPNRLGSVTPARPSGVSGSSYEDIRARNVTLLSNSPLAAGSPWQPRLRPGSGSLQPSPAQSSGAAGTPIGQPPPALSSRPFPSVGPSRFGLRDGPAPSPLALTPAAQPFRATAARGSRPFVRTPIHMQPLCTSVPASSIPAPAASAGAASEAAPLSWTPMRTYSSMQPRTGTSLSLKRGRADGSPLGTPLLGAGLAADSERRIRRRGEQGAGSAEPRVWKAAQTPYNAKAAAGKEVLAIEGPSVSAAAQAPNGVLGGREPLPMTESARRIAMALDAMLPTASSPLAHAESAAASAPPKPVAPPTDSLGVAPAPMLSTAPTPATPSLALPPSLPMDAFRKPATSIWAPLSQPASSTAQSAAASSGSQWPIAATAPAASWPKLTPTISLPVEGDTAAGASGSQQLPTSPAPCTVAPLPLTPICPSFPQPSTLFKFSTAQKVETASDGPAVAEQPEGPPAKFSFRPARSLLDSAEKLRPPAQPQPAAAAHEKVLAENDRAAAAASQPLPASDDEDEDSGEDGIDDGDIKGVMRSSARAEENGDAAPAAERAQPSAAPVSAAGGWDLGFLKQNQAQQAAAAKAAEQAIEAEKPGAQPKLQAEQASAPAMGGWGSAFLSANKAAAEAATAAAKEELDKAAGKSSSGPTPAPFTISFGNPTTPSPGTAASSGSGLLSFLGSVVPNSSSTAFAPSTSSGFSFGAVKPAEASQPVSTAALIPAPASSALPSFGLPSAHTATENGDAPVSKAEAPAFGLPKKAAADAAPASSGGFSFGGGALPLAFSAASSSSAAATASVLLSTSKPGAYSFGAKPEDTKPATAPAADQKETAPKAAASEAPAAASAPAPAASLSFGAAVSSGPASFGSGATASSAAAAAPFSFGISSAPAASQPEASARAPISFQLKPAAAPFVPSLGFTFGKQAADASKEETQDPPESGRTGLSLTQAEGSARSLDSNMSVSPSAGAAGASNPFVALETGPTPEAPSTTGFSSFMAPSSSAPAATTFAFGASSAASSAAQSGFLAPAAGTGMGFRSSSLTAFGASSTPAFGAAPASAAAQSSAAVSIFGANANSGFGGAAFGPASASAFGASNSGALTFGASSTPAFGASSTPAFSAGSAPAFGASSTPAIGQASAPAFGAGSTPAFGAGSAPAFGGFVGGGFGAPAAPAFGAFGGGAGAFGAQPQSAPAAAAPFGASHTAPAWGAPTASTPTFGQAPPQPAANATPGPFGAPLQPAFGIQQQQQPAAANPFSFQGAPSGGLGGDAASGFTMGAGDSQQQQQGQLARRKVKVKRRGR